MKSQIVKKVIKETHINYSVPQLYVSKDKDTIVLSIGESLGNVFTAVVLWEENDNYGIGHFSLNWNPSNFDLFTGELKLKN